MRRWSRRWSGAVVKERVVLFQSVEWEEFPRVMGIPWTLNIFSQQRRFIQQPCYVHPSISTILFHRFLYGSLWNSEKYEKLSINFLKKTFVGSYKKNQLDRILVCMFSEFVGRNYSNTHFRSYEFRKRIFKYIFLYFCAIRSGLHMKRWKREAKIEGSS